MSMLTIRRLPKEVVASLKRLAKRHRRSMEQEARQILTDAVADRLAALDEIEASWSEQRRRATASEVAGWISDSRP
jgi:plasmid stability protein